MGFLKDRVHRDLSEEDVKKIANTYHNWRKGANYENEKGFCSSASLTDIEKHGFVLTPGRYVGILDAIDDGIPFEVKMGELTKKLGEQMVREKELDEEIKVQLAKIGFSI